MAKRPAPASAGRPVWIGAAAPVEPAPLAALEAADARDEVRELRAPLTDEAADSAADEADSATELIAPEAAELADAATLEASLAALPVSEPKTVLKPLVVTTTEPAEFVTVPTMGTTVTTLWPADWAAEASEPVTEAAADAAAPDAVARALVRMPTAGGGPAEPEATPAHWLRP